MSLLTDPGDLAETPLAAILLEALNTRSSGVLEVAHGGGTSRLWFRDGRPVGAQVFAGFKPLGMMLLQAGLIDIDALSRSLALMAEKRRPQGELLVELGAVSAADVARVLAEQQAGYFAIIAALDAGRVRLRGVHAGAGVDARRPALAGAHDRRRPGAAPGERPRGLGAPARGRPAACGSRRATPRSPRPSTGPRSSGAWSRGSSARRRSRASSRRRRCRRSARGRSSRRCSCSGWRGRSRRRRRRS